MPKALVFCFVMLSLTPTHLGTDALMSAYFVVWNVGQGQWATAVEKETCHHFDLGGERAPLRKIQRLCAQKENRFHLSHWDWDHIGFVRRARRVLKNHCLALAPCGKSKAYKMKLLAGLKDCGRTSSAELDLRILTSFENSCQSKTPNSLSHVLLVQGQYLLPGDSPSPQEKLWGSAPSLGPARVLILGHHGSKTSTSEFLLSRLPRLKIAVASARSSRYGHPHREVIERLRKHRVPLLKTEDWGNLWFQVPVGKVFASSLSR